MMTEQQRMKISIDAYVGYYHHDYRAAYLNDNRICLKFGSNDISMQIIATGKCGEIILIKRRSRVEMKSRLKVRNAIGSRAKIGVKVYSERGMPYSLMKDFANKSWWRGEFAGAPALRLMHLIDITIALAKGKTQHITGEVSINTCKNHENQGEMVEKC